MGLRRIGRAGVPEAGVAGRRGPAHLPSRLVTTPAGGLAESNAVGGGETWPLPRLDDGRCQVRESELGH